MCASLRSPTLIAVILLLAILSASRADANPPEVPALMRATSGVNTASIPPEVTGPTAIVKMSDDMPMYQPSSLMIRAGQTVEWVNTGQVSHSVVDDPAKAGKSEDVLLPNGARTFASGNVMPGGKYRYTFLTPGTYRYFCMSHEMDAMVGEIIVQPPTPADVAREATQLKSQPWRASEHPSAAAPVDSR